VLTNIPTCRSLRSHRRAAHELQGQPGRLLLNQRLSQIARNFPEATNLKPCRMVLLGGSHNNKHNMPCIRGEPTGKHEQSDIRKSSSCPKLSSTQPSKFHSSAQNKSIKRGAFSFFSMTVVNLSFLSTSRY